METNERNGSKSKIREGKNDVDKRLEILNHFIFIIAFMMTFSL
jgi:hypothetical protein